MQGASPLASPGLNPGGTGYPCRLRPRRGAQGGGRLPTLPLWCPQGGLPSMSPAYPAFSLLSFPHPPNPLPGGKGETYSFLMQGASPLASPRLNPRGTYNPCQAGARGGLVLFAVRLPCRCGVRRGACPLCRLPALPLVCFTAPYLPNPLPSGKGGIITLFRRGLRPRHPCTEPLAALTISAIQVPCERELAARCKNDGNAFLWAVPVAKERGDRGRGTSAFEMVLSPGAGRASAVGGKPPPPYYRKSGRSWRPASAAERADGTSEKSATSECGLRAGSS